MENMKARRKGRNILTQGQNRLLKESLKQLLGPGLGQSQPQRSQREERALLLREAFSAKFLDSEWLS